MKNVNPDCVHTCITKPFEDFKTDMIAALTHIELTDLHHDDPDSASDIYTVCDDECYDGLSLFNEFYDEIDLAPTPLGESVGWNVMKGLIDIHFGSQIAEDGRPCIVIDHNVAPVYGYDKTY